MPRRWRYEPLSDVEKPLSESLKTFPRERHMWMWSLRTAAALVIRAWLRVVHRFAVTGRENLPASGSFVLVANHASHWDTLCMLSALPLARVHRAFPAAAADYFFTNLPRSYVSAVLVNALPFDRQEKGRESIELCREVLESPGNALVLFPEGTRTDDGQVHEFKPGVGFLTAGTPFPVVPCYLRGGFESWPKTRALPRLGRLALTIGAPRTYAHLPPGKESALLVADDLRRAVVALAQGE